MIDNALDRLYRPIRISNRMRLAKLLLLRLLVLGGSGYDPSIHISSSTPPSLAGNKSSASPI